MKLHVVIEYGLTRIRIVLAPVGRELALVVDKSSSLKEISIVIQAVIIETVRIKRLPPMLEHHILSCLHHLSLAIIPCVVARERQSVTLAETHMSKGSERVGGLIIVSAVAKQRRPAVDEVDMSLGDLCIRIGTKLIILQLIRVS